MGLSNEQQAFVLAVAAFFIALGTATATIPDIVPADIRVPLSIFFWFCGIIGFALKEALGGTLPNTVPTNWQLDSIKTNFNIRLADLQSQIAELTKTHPQTQPPPTENPTSETAKESASENPT